MKAGMVFVSAILIADTFFASYFYGFHTRTVAVEDPKLPPYKAPAPAVKPKPPEPAAKKITEKTKTEAPKKGKTKAKGKTGKPKHSKSKDE